MTDEANPMAAALVALEKLSAKVDVLVKVNEHLFGVSQVFIKDLARIAQGEHADGCSCKRRFTHAKPDNACMDLAVGALTEAAKAQTAILLATQQKAAADL